MGSAVVEYISLHHTVILFAVALFLSIVWLLYFFFRLNRDVFGTLDVAIISNGAALVGQVLVFVILKELVLTAVLAALHLLGILVQVLFIVVLRPRRITYQRGAKVAVLPFLTEGAEAENWEVGYGISDVFSRLLSAYDIVVLDPVRVAAGFIRRKVTDDARAVEWGRLLDADYIIIGSARIIRENIQVRYRILKIDEGIEWRRRRFLEPKENLFVLSKNLSDDLAQLFGLTLRNPKAYEYYLAPTKDLRAWTYYCDGRRYQILPTVEDLESAIRVYDQAVGLDEDFTLAAVSAVESYLSLARRRVHEEAKFLDLLEKAYRIALRAVKNHPELYETQNAMGEVFVFLSGGRDHDLFGRAQTRFLEAVRLYPNSARSWYNLALISKYTFDKLEESGYVEFLEKALSSDPSFVPARIALARFLLDKGLKAEAEEHYDRALEFNPENIQLLNEIGFYLIKENRTAEAIKALEKARDIEPDNHQTRHYLGLAYMRNGMFQEAEDEIRAAIRIRPGDVQLYYSLSRMLEKAGKFGEAVEVLENAAGYIESPSDRQKVQQHIVALSERAREQQTPTTDPVGPESGSPREGS